MEAVKANQLLVEALDALRELGDSCDHNVGICWCGHWDLCDEIGSYLDSQGVPHKPTRPNASEE